MSNQSESSERKMQIMQIQIQSLIHPQPLLFQSHKEISSRGMEDFQLDGKVLTRIAMMAQDHYPVKLAINSDLGCIIVQMQHDVSMFVFLPDEVTANITLVEESTH
ncbi:unnamed protein product [Coregonus sp. 'balchen']|nr:unnamed protein product [Coregonus sp. 'balchen']